MSGPVQGALFGDAPKVDPGRGPPGFRLTPEFLDAWEETQLLGRLAELPFAPFRFRGFEGRRQVVSFGLRYDFEGGGLQPAPPIPGWLVPVRDRAAAFAGLEPDRFAHLLVNAYPPGAPIGWHRDRPQFDKVVGVSLGAPTVMRFRLRDGVRFQRRNVPLPPRSAYLLDGPARSAWEHSLPEAHALRYSLTFRSLRP